MKDYEVRQAIKVLEALVRRAEGLPPGSFLALVLMAAYRAGEGVLDKAGWEIEATGGGISWRKKVPA